MNLKYNDEDDKCYGITGMAISVVIWNSEDKLSRIDLDAEPAESVEFVPDFYFSGNPRVSAKTAWATIFNHYQTSMGMLIGNVMCRSYVLHRQAPEAALKRSLLEYADAEGREACALEADEVQRVFDRSYQYLDKVFRHSGVQALAHRFADTLRRQRVLTRADIIEQLEELSRL